MEDERAHSLTTQALLAYSAVVGMKQCAAHLCFDVNHKSVERVYGSLHHEIASKVRLLQQDIVVFNTNTTWVDVEADEVIV
eukprot:3099395-Amphidinium_carterae.1